VKVVRIYTGDDGESHFEDVEIELKDLGPSGHISEMWGAKGVMFRPVEGSYALDFHTAPRRQLVVNLTGSDDLIVGDGTVRRLQAGEILLAEDLTGRGHKSTNVGGEPRTCLFIPLDDD